RAHSATHDPSSLAPIADVNVVALFTRLHIDFRCRIAIRGGRISRHVIIVGIGIRRVHSAASASRYHVGSGRKSVNAVDAAIVGRALVGHLAVRKRQSIAIANHPGPHAYTNYRLAALRSDGSREHATFGQDNSYRVADAIVGCRTVVTQHWSVSSKPGVNLIIHTFAAYHFKLSIIVGGSCFFPAQRTKRANDHRNVRQRLSTLIYNATSDRPRLCFWSSGDGRRRSLSEHSNRA